MTTSSTRFSSASPRSHSTSCAPPSFASAGDASPQIPNSSAAFASTTETLLSSASSQVSTGNLPPDPLLTRPAASLLAASLCSPTAARPGGGWTAATGSYLHDWKSRAIVVWGPSADHYRVLAYPPQLLSSSTVVIDGGALLCAARDQGHLHGDCHSSLFKVVLLATLRNQRAFTVASVYFSETGMWSDFISTSPLCLIMSMRSPGTLVGNVIHGMSLKGMGGIQFDLDSHRLALIESPTGVHGTVQFIHSENGGVALASLSSLSDDPHFQMWEMKVSSYGVAGWVLRKTLKLQNILGLGFRISNDKSSIVGYAEDTRAIFLQVHTSVYMLQLDSMQSKELFKRDQLRTYHPFTTFYSEGL